VRKVTERWRGLYPAGDGQPPLAALRLALMRYAEGASSAQPAADAVVTAIALWLESDMRDYFAGRQPTGAVVMSSRTVMVTDSATPTSVETFLSTHERGVEAQRLLDRGLWLLRRATEETGLRLLEWERPAYDDVTPIYRRLLAFSAGGGALGVDEPAFEVPGEHRNPREQTEEASAKRGVPVKHTIVVVLLFAMVGVALLVLTGLAQQARPTRQDSTSPPLSCDEQAAKVEAELAREIALRESAGRSVVTLRRALPEVRAKRYRQAETILEIDHSLDTAPFLGVVILNAELACEVGDP